MRILRMKRLLVGSAIGLMMLLGAASANAQNPTEEYREWQRAQRIAQEEYRDYLRTRRSRDYRDWQRAQRFAQQEYNEYLMASRGYNGRTGVGVNVGFGRRYRLYRDGRTYEIDYRGAEVLRTAVNRGYQQGFVAGRRDRRLGRAPDDYFVDSTYRNAMIGYQPYVARDQYQYYFQQGFQRGYEDGYYSRYRYGTRSGTTANILGSVLNTILNLAAN